MRSSATRLLFVCLASLLAFSATGATLTGIVPPSAPHGARVLLAGSGLDAPDLVVTFSDGSGNPVTAAIVASTAKTAEVVVPSAAASGLVQASAAGTTFGTASFTLLSDPAFTSVRTLALSDKSNDVFKALGGVALEPNGIVVIADTAHNVVSIMAPGSAPTVLAGTPSKSGFQDGSGAQALFKQPAAVAYDAAKNLIYVADTGNNAIRTVAADGTVSTIASAAAQFKAPQAIAVDANGNLLVADTGNSEIRLVTPSGSVSTLAGSLHSGFADGAVSQALFNAPSGIAVDRDGAVYVADAGNNRIRKIANGSVTTIAGTAQQGWADGPAAFAQFKLPGGIAVDDAGNIYVSDTANNVIRLISGGNVSTIAGNGKQGLIDGSPVAASFKAPAGLAYGGGVFVADSGNDAVRLLVPELKFSAVYPASGPEAGGNSVRLFGSGFVNGLTSVAVNGANVSATFVTSTELLIPSMPSGTATVSMAITTPAGTVQLSNCYTYLPPPTVATVQPNKGKTAGGDVVTITGTNFGSIDDTSVTFGSTAATVTSVTSASIAVTTPAGSAGTVDVTVSTPGGSATRSSAFTYLDPPTIASIAPTAGKTAGGDGITATGTNFDDTTTTLTIGGVPATNVVVVSPTSLTATTPAGSAGPVNVAVTTAGGSAMLSGGFTYVPPPVIASFTPTSGTAGSNVTITGQNFATVAANDTVTIGGAAAAVVSATATQLIVTVPANAISGAIAVTAIGGTATSATPFTVITYRSLAVTSPVTSLQPATQQQFTAIVTLVDNTTRDVTSSATWSSSNPTVASVSSTGLVSAATSGAADISATFSGLSATLHVVVQSGFGLPPATMQGPPLDPTIISPLADTIRFLYTGPNAIQTGVAANTIDDNRSAVISGRVTDRSGAAVPGVQVTVAQHPEYAETLTRVDGRYDLAFNGGGPLHLIFSKSGFLPADRLVTTKWNQQKTIDDVALVAYDTAVTTITSNPPVPQVAQGSLSSDTDGNRRATMYFPPGVAATLINADGTTQAATTLHVRATEYTVGPNGPKAMPAVLPPNSGYTYCVELSVDEAPGVTFSQSVPVYVENFLGFPVGSVVPVGYFDRTKDLWVPALNGVVIKIVSVTNGAAALDTDGDGNPDTQDRLTALGIDTNELRQLGSLYTTGQTLWRVQVDHFTPWDMNWPYGPPSDAVSPLPPPPDTSITVTQCEECQGHSIVETENQRLREEIPVQGTPYSLTYNSGRANRQRYQVTVHVSGAAVLPASLKAMDVSFSIAGRSFTQSLLPEQNKDLTFTWDGVDVYNRPVQGVRPADISVGYRYAAAYRPPQTSIQAFAASGVGTSAITDRTRNEVTFAQGWSVPLGQWSNNTTGFGGWSFSAQRVYDTIGRTLYDPEATERGSDLALNGESAIYRVAGTGFPGVPDTSLLATQSGTEGALSVQPTPDGGFYFADDSPGSLDPSCQCLKFVDQAIFKVDAAGHVAVVAGIPGCSNNCPAGADGAPAATSWVSPSHVTTSLDGTVYFSEITFSGSNRADRIRRIVNGRLQTVAGAPTILVGDNGPATQAGLGTVNGIAIGNDGVLYIATVSAGIRRVGVDGIITTIAGMGISRADNIPATQSKFVSPMGVAVGPDGSVYFSCTQAGPNFTPAIGRISPDGFLHFVAGGGPFLPAGQDGSVATAVSIQSPGGLGVTAEGDPVWGDTSNSRAFVWTVKAGILHVITTSPTARQVFTGNAPADGALARSVFMFRIPETKVGPDGSVYLIDGGHWTILKTAPLFPAMKSGSASTIIPANDGIVGYIFENGRHVRTVNTITGTTLETLSYDANGLLKSVTDVDGQSTIDRDSAGNPTVITAPGGQQTQLSVGAQGLESVSSAAGNYAFSYNSLGLLSQLTDPRTGLHKFTYDESGLLTKDEDPAGGFLSLTRTGTTGNFTVVRGSAEGRTESLAWHQSSDVLTTRPVTGSDGLVTTRNENGDGSKNETSPEGVTTATTVGPDTRFGMSAPVMLTESDTMPSGTKLNLTSSRQVFLSHDSDPLSLLTYSSTLGINGRVFTSAFTKSNRTVVTTTPAGRQITTVLNDKDRPASVQVAGLASVAYGYDPRGMISSVTVGSRNTTFGYDARQRLKSIRDPLGRTVSYDYDDADRVTTETLPDGRQIQFSHDAAGNVTSISPPARPAHTFGFTPVNLLESYTAPTVANVTSTVTTYTYNRDRQLTLAARPDGTTVDWGYDSAGRLATITEPRGQHAFTYEATKGTLTGISAPDGNALQFTYDGGLLRSLSSTGAVASTIAFNYDNNLRVTSESVNGANSIAFGYDNDDLLTSAGVLTLRRDASNGLLTGTTLSNVVDTYGYNTFGEVTSYTLQLGGSTIFTLGYTRDDAGRIAAKTETANGQTATTSYGYDPAGRLTDVTSAGTTTHYDYDDNGNRTGVTTDSGQIVATYDAQDRLTTYNGASYFYSANGDLQKKIDAQGTTLYSYDALGNLRSVTLPDGKLIEYVIDASNRRVGKKVNGSLVVGWIYSGPLRIVAETDGTGAVSKRFIYGSRPNVPDYMVWQGSAYRIVTDHLGSPRYVLEVSGGSLADAVTYDAFGAVVSDTNRGFVPFGFAGGLYDPDTGLTRYGLRDYDAATGRWTSKDPLLFWGTGRSDYDWTTNTYQYCDGDPVNFSDPTGLQMDSVSRSLQEAIARGDADEIAEILEDAGEELPDKLRAAARKAVQRFRSKAKDIISKECKGSINREFPEEFRDKTLQDIWKEARGGDKAAQTAKKLLSDARFRK